MYLVLVQFLWALKYDIQSSAIGRLPVFGSPQARLLPGREENSGEISRSLVPRAFREVLSS